MEALISRFLDDRFSLTGEEAKRLVRALRDEPAFAASLKEQLLFDDMLSRSRNVSRRHFSDQMAQRMREHGKGNGFQARVMQTVADRAPQGADRGPEDTPLMTVDPAETPESVPVSRPRPGARRMRAMAATAAAVALAATVGALVLFRSPENEVIAGRVRVDGVEGGRIEDGSRVEAAGEEPAVIRLRGRLRMELAPASVAVVQGATKDARQVVALIRGSGTFRVVRDPGLFRVVTSVGSVTVLGTEFSVALQEATSKERGSAMLKKTGMVMVVAVLAGSVEVSHDGQRYVLEAGARQAFAGDAEHNQPGQDEWDGDSNQQVAAASGENQGPKPHGIPAFPGAEGYGSLTRGGRGGEVIAVTNLNASGPGSLRAACEAKGPRIVVFRASGTIDTDVSIRNDYITIAGQTAPGNGITIKGTLGIGANDVIIRYVRVRAEGRGDAVGGRYKKNIILDHVSASWSGDEVLSIYHCENVTIQWCMITEACSRDHKFGGIWGSDYSTYHHNLLAHNASRNPRWASGCGSNDYRNNVIYNWGHNSCYGGEAHQSGDRRNPPIASSRINMVANYYRPGPGTKSSARSRIADPSTRGGDADAGKWWVSGNFVAGSPSVTADNWKGVTKTGPAFRLDRPWPAVPINQQTAEEAYKAVLDGAGCSLPNRDVIDTRIIEEVRTGTAGKGDNGFVDSPSIAGGWPSLKGGTAPADSDHDGMPDAWEGKFGLDPEDAGDNTRDKDRDGYTNIEEYLNGTDPTVFVDYAKRENNINTLK